jgi:hypothetical protein
MAWEGIMKLVVVNEDQPIFEKFNRKPKEKDQRKFKVKKNDRKDWRTARLIKEMGQ